MNCLFEKFARSHMAAANLLAFVAVGTFSWVHIQPVAAQKKDEINAGGSALEIAKAEGKLEAMQGQTLKIKSDSKDMFLVMGQQTAVKFSGDAEASWLQPGLYVRFSSSFDAQGRPTAALKNLEVFLPSTSNRLSAEQQRDQTPGIYQESKSVPPGAKEVFADKKAPPPKNAPAAAPAGQAMRVVGTVRAVQGSKLMIAAGMQPVQIELDPSVVIAVTATDLSFINQGDNVTVSGLRNPAEPSWIQAERIEIKAGKKLTQAQPIQRGKSRSTKGKDSKEDKDSKDPKNSKEDPKKPGTPEKKTPASK